MWQQSSQVSSATHSVYPPCVYNACTCCCQMHSSNADDMGCSEFICHHKQRLAVSMRYRKTLPDASTTFTDHQQLSDELNANLRPSQLLVQKSKSVAKRRREEAAETNADKAAKRMRLEMRQRGHVVCLLTLAKMPACPDDADLDHKSTACLEIRQRGHVVCLSAYYVISVCL